MNTSAKTEINRASSGRLSDPFDSTFVARFLVIGSFRENVVRAATTKQIPDVAKILGPLLQSVAAEARTCRREGRPRSVFFMWRVRLERQHCRDGALERPVLTGAIEALGIDPGAPAPWTV